MTPPASGKTPSANSLLVVEALVAGYHGNRVLDGISLSVAPGEIFVVMGASGSGKSTLLKIILGLKQPVAGRVELLGHDLPAIGRRELYAIRRRIGVAFQREALFSSMSVEDNIKLPLREHTKLDEATIEIMCRMKLAMLNLTGKGHLMPAELSGGMRKRVSLARAVIMDPTLLFFDEPSAGLDPVLAAELDQLILDLRDALGMTIVVITHDIQSAMKIADRILIIDQGRALASGTPAHIRHSDDPLVNAMVGRKPLQREYLI